ncbi:MAG TPA: halocarboxylic acid dehydrogenase DehI family protein, partial [Candidatus Angelobacter sp.]|nr:halocarboxylic acid dehydrogenase DehI family protein [Candidatus Angelobacter sp.]
MNWKRHKLRLVTEKEARGRTKEIFEEIKQAMGVPHVNIIFQALASFPEFFNHFWKTAKPLLHTQEFF